MSHVSSLFLDSFSKCVVFVLDQAGLHQKTIMETAAFVRFRKRKRKTASLSFLSFSLQLSFLCLAAVINPNVERKPNIPVIFGDKKIRLKWEDSRGCGMAAICRDRLVGEREIREKTRCSTVAARQLLASAAEEQRAHGRRKRTGSFALGKYV